jgi:integrase
MGYTSNHIEIKSLRTEAYRKLISQNDSWEYWVKLMALANGQKKPLKAKRDVVIVLLALCLGLRVGEICNLTLEDIDLEKKMIWILGKGDLEKKPLLMPQILIDGLTEYLSYRLCYNASHLFFNLAYNGKDF